MLSLTKCQSPTCQTAAVELAASQRVSPPQHSWHFRPETALLGGCPGPSRLFNNTPGLCPPDANGTRLAPLRLVKIEDVSKHRQTSPGAKLPLGENHRSTRLYFNHYSHVWAKRTENCITAIKAKNVIKCIL